MLGSFDAVLAASTNANGEYPSGAPAIVPATSGLTVDAVWDDPSASGARTELGNLSSASAAAYLTLNNTDSGVIIEAGGAAKGLVLYAFSGVLYFHCGNGFGFNPSFNKGVASWAIPNASDVEYLIEWSANSGSGYAELFVDGVSVDVSASYSNNGITGADDGGIGRVFSSVCDNRGGWVGSDDGIFTNTIVRADIFVDQTVGGA
jgi:hypothetical protein